MFDFLKKKKKEVTVACPFNGTVVLLEEVPDPAFAQKIVGDGFAIRPEGELIEVKAPVDGTLSALFPTGHAFGIQMENGFEVLVHLGIDTVELKGEGFTLLKAQGDTVKAGDPVVQMDVKKIQELGKEVITPVVFTNQAIVKEVKVHQGVNPDPACTVSLN